MRHRRTQGGGVGRPAGGIRPAPPCCLATGDAGCRRRPLRHPADRRPRLVRRREEQQQRRRARRHTRAYLHGELEGVAPHLRCQPRPGRRHARPAVRARATARPRTPARWRATSATRSARSTSTAPRTARSGCPGSVSKAAQKCALTNGCDCSGGWAESQVAEPRRRQGRRQDLEAGQAARPADDVLRDRVGLHSAPEAVLLRRRPQPLSRRPSRPSCRPGHRRGRPRPDRVEIVHIVVTGWRVS